MSPLMRHLLRSWLDWVEAGAPQLSPYSRDEGLCLAVYRFVTATGQDDPGRAARVLHRELTQMFCADGLSHVVPFDRGSYTYDRDEVRGMHCNPHRVEWVRERLS